MTDQDVDSLTNGQLCYQLEPLFRRMILEGTREKLPTIIDRDSAYLEVPAVSIASFCEKTVRRMIRTAMEDHGYRVLSVTFENFGCEERSGLYFIFEAPEGHGDSVRAFATRRLRRLDRHVPSGATFLQDSTTRYLFHTWDQIANPPTKTGEKLNDHVVLSVGGVQTLYVDQTGKGRVTNLDIKNKADNFKKQDCLYARVSTGLHQYEVPYQELTTKWEYAFYDWVGQTSNTLAAALPYILPEEQRKELLREYKKERRGVGEGFQSIPLDATQLSVSQAKTFVDKHFKVPATFSTYSNTMDHQEYRGKGSKNRHVSASSRDPRYYSKDETRSRYGYPSKGDRERSFGQGRNYMRNMRDKDRESPEATDRLKSKVSVPASSALARYAKTPAITKKTATSPVTTASSKSAPQAAVPAIPRLTTPTTTSRTTTTTSLSVPTTTATAPVISGSNLQTKPTSPTPATPKTITKSHHTKETISTTVATPQLGTQKDTKTSITARYTKKDEKGTIVRTTTASETSQVTSKDESSPLTPPCTSPQGMKRKMMKDFKLNGKEKNQSKRLKTHRKLVEEENSRQLNQKAKSKDKNPEGSIPPNPPPSPVSSVGTPLEDEETSSLTPNNQTTTYREYHSSDEASDPGGYKLTKKVQHQQQLATDQCTDTYLVDYEPLDTDTDDSDEEVELNEEERLRLQEEARVREEHFKKVARIRRRAEKKAKSGASL